MSTVPEPPYSIDPSVLPRLGSEYVKFFDDNLTHAKEFLYTQLIPVEQLRAAGNVMPGQSPLAEMESTYDAKVASTALDGYSIPIRVFTPKGKKPESGWPCMVWFHGGGWVLGNINTENSFCTNVAELSRCVVVSVDYRMAPEHPFPGAIEDALDVISHLLVNPASFNIDRSRLGVGGSSAGGNISAVVSHVLSDPSEKRYADLPKLKFQLLIVPVCDNTASEESHLSWKEMELTPQLSAEKMRWYRRLYLPNEADWKNPQASPAFYSKDSFARNPPAFVAVAECDVLRTEGELYAEKLKSAGVESQLVIYPGVPHPVMAMGEVLEQARILLKETTTWISEKLQS